MLQTLTRYYQTQKTRIHRLSAEGGWVVVGQIAVATASLVAVRVLTEYLAPNQYGQLALALTLGSLIGQVAFSGAMPGIMRFYTLAAEKGEVREYLKASIRMMGYGVVIALAFSGLLLTSLPIFGKSNLMVAASLAIIFTVLGNFNTAQNLIQNAARQRKVVAFHSSMDAWLKTLLAVALINWFASTATIVVTAYIVSILIVLTSQAILMRRLIPQHGNTIKNPELWEKKIWHYSKPFVYFNAFTWVQASADRWALDLFTTTNDVGLYTVLLQLGYTPIGMIAGLVTTLIAPILFQRSGDASESTRNTRVHQQAWLITSIAAATTLLAFTITAVFHEFIFLSLVAGEYRSVSHLLPWMTLAGGLFATGQILSIKIMSDLNTNALVWPKIVTSIVGAALSFFGAYWLGLVGVVAAAVVFSIIQLVWISLLSLRPAPQK